ncbi:hypothetical protein KP509_23G010200 [Ceratopteris richardii]|uniref:Methyltransferase n=1 Tax=Ceratopteris richardii TaxID=49495 RepID=A0A8T2RZQ6_CERRI|nr:hypothetical protein KP509_23G010200 [Ceratopteris richardii]
MKDKEGKIGLSSEKMNKLLPPVLVLLSLCSLSFYMGGIFCGEKGAPQSSSSEITVALSGCQPQTKFTKFVECNISLQDLTPCTDPLRWRKYDKFRMAFRERHCPAPSERLECLVPPPPGYKVPVRWPRSRDECWNVPYDWINTAKANQRWMQKKGEKFIFPGGGTMFPNGVDEYIDQMEELIPGMKDGTVRTALDTGCGVASWGGALLDRGILTMSLAPRDNHEAQVQFALERGIPAMLGIISTQRLPYPANAFDMAHCSRCLIPWTAHGGVFLLEVDRVLRPGGFWVLSGPPVNYEIHWKGWESTEEKEKANLEGIQDLLERMCYKQYAMKGDIAVWQKPLDDTCYNARGEDVTPPVCDDSIDPDAAWYVPMRPCIVKMNPAFQRLGLGQTPKWPDRLTTAPERSKLFSGGSESSFRKDTRMWENVLKYYKSLLPDLGTNQIRNVMDMNTKYGGLAAAMIKDPVWVMNVVSSYAANSLGVIYDRGLIGTVNDWCEAFSTYPRTYDLLHVDGLFTAESHRCEMKFVLLEMDRLLRPKGHVILRDSPNFVEMAKRLGQAMRWSCKIHVTEDPVDIKEQLLICQKNFWTSAEE